jgi:O-antigen ligase
MGAFDTDKDYNAIPYNGQQRMQSVTWIVISVIFGCVFIAKRLYFKREKERRPTKDNINTQTDFIDVMSDVLLCLLWFIFIFGPPNPAIMTILYIIFFIILLFLLRWLWMMIFRKKNRDEFLKIFEK